jgi:glycerophosphoryl diester phosphodiesterase
MHVTSRYSILIAAALTTVLTGAVASAEREHPDDDRQGGHLRDNKTIQVGPRPYFLVDGMRNSPLKNRLQGCADEPVKRTDFSIGHRGAALQFPEHTRESYEAAARMGAGIVECDVTFTKDGTLVCRHAQNDLHTTTDILVTPGASSCAVPFKPAVLNALGQPIQAATASCLTSDITLHEFRSLRGKMDAFNPAATTPQQYLGGTAPWRTDLYTSRGTLMTFRESIALNQKLGVKHTPELKAGDPASIAAVFGSQEGYAQALINELQHSGVRPRDAWPQSFNVNDVLYWVRNTAYGAQSVFLIDYNTAADNIILSDTTGRSLVTRDEQLTFFRTLRRAGVKVLAPTMPALLAVSGNRVVPSRLAVDLKAMGFDLITWTLERSDLRKGAASAGFYYDFDPTGAAIQNDSDMYEALHVLAKDVEILGIFSDWPATVSYYASCMDLR